MVTQKKRWKITNITVRPVRINPVTKKDERTTIEKNGYNLCWREDNTPSKSNIILGPNQFKLVSDVTDGMIGFVHEGLASIEEFGDVADVLKAFASTGKRTQRRGIKEAPPVGAGVAAIPDTAQPQGRRQARAAEMGEKITNKEERAEHVDAVNPTGTPNFVVNAPSDETRRRQRHQQPTV